MRHATYKARIPLVISTLAAFPLITMAAIPLGTASNFAVLAGSTVTNTGPSVIQGNVGVAPGTAITGFLTVDGGPGLLAPPSSFHAADSVAAQAQTDLLTAYNAAKGLTPVKQDLTGQDLGGKTLTPGVYFFSSSAQLTGTLTLNDLGDPNAQFVFQIGTTLKAADNDAHVVASGGGNNVYWQVGSSATLGTYTEFIGNILAHDSITMNTGANILNGRALAIGGAVTLDTNRIAYSSVPEAGTILLGALATMPILAHRRRRQGPDAL